MKHYLKFTIILSLLYNLNAATNLKTGTTTATTAAAETSRGLNWWSPMLSSIDHLLVMKKNLIAALPFQIAAGVIDMLCSSTLYMHHVPEKVTPNISNMNFLYITPCKNYSVPLTEAHKLWQHMNFNRMNKIVIVATGWTNTINVSSTVTMLSQAFLCRKDVNFIIVDTASYIDTIYKWAVLNTEVIGEHIAKGLAQLVKVVPLQNIHLVGHSLGAHIMGSAGRTFTKLTGQHIPRITGLDPAKPCFWKEDKLVVLNRGDARFVDIIHTNMGILAKGEPMGDVDFYPGGAYALPPGCLTISCAHTRAVLYFAESVYPGNEFNFLGFKCDTWKKLMNIDCYGSVTSPMGYYANNAVKGVFYVDVNRKSPFGKQAKPNSIRWENSKCHICSKKIKLI